MSMATLQELADENRRCYEADIHTADYERKLQASNARYIPALEAEVERLQLALSEAVALSGDQSSVSGAVQR